MAVLGLDHVNVRSADPGATAAFFADILGMRVGPPMGRTDMTGPGGWVYDSAPSGKYGDDTATIVRAFQRHWRPATVDGIADGETRARLMALLRLAAEG